MRPYEKELIALIETQIKQANLNDHPYDIASDIYDVIAEYMIKAYDEGYEDGIYEAEYEK